MRWSYLIKSVKSKQVLHIVYDSLAFKPSVIV